MPNANSVVDLSHHNGNVDLARAKAAGITGVIHKATQGAEYLDPAYVGNRAQADSNGLSWGAYHFGIGGDGVAQAEHFLSVVNPRDQDLLVLDLEANPQGPSMTLEEARAFVTHVHDQVERWPGLYAGHFLKEILGTGNDPVLGRCWFWLAQYGPTPVVPANWNTWKFWQYTDGGLGPEPHAVDGIGRCDRNNFNGDAAQLVAFWSTLHRTDYT